MGVGWLGEPTQDALRDALRAVAPELADGTIVVPPLDPGDDPTWWAANAVVDGRYTVKFAWARTPALRLRHQTRVLEALRAAAPGLPLPEVVRSCADPALLVLRRVRATPFFDLRARIGPRERDAAARDLASVLAQLHRPGVLAALTEAAGPLPEPTAHATTDTLRARFPALVGPDRRDRVLAWCDRADTALAGDDGPAVLVHGDFHGDNHLWDADTLRLRLVVDLETAGVGEPEFDMRCLPGDCGVELFTATVAHYAALTGRTPDVDRIMAWHLRTVLGDALWRAEAGVALPDHRTPAQWVDDLGARFAALGTSA